MVKGGDGRITQQTQHSSSNHNNQASRGTRHKTTEMEEEQQQQQQTMCIGVLAAITRLADPRYREKRHKLRVSGPYKPRVGRYSWEHLIAFLDGRRDS
jgi:hypothetical protein